jgi:predicted alpha/beta superfamily hydrolase
MMFLALVGLALAGCDGAADAPSKQASVQADQPHSAPATPTSAMASGGQRGGGLPYEVAGSEVWDVPDPVSHRDYQIFVALPSGYGEEVNRRYPVLYVTDADYAFPLIRQMARRLNGEGPELEDFILVGLSYAKGDSGMDSRRRDYTPTEHGASGAPGEAVHGQGAAYAAYLRDQVLPFVAKRYRTDESRRLFLGHSYGSLLGTQILLREPQLFSGYILGSPSYWYDNHVMATLESDVAATHRDLPAKVYMYIGQYEQRSHGKRYDMVSDAQRMVRALEARRYPSLRIELEVLNDEDHLSVAPRGFMHGLKALLADPAR